jgi:hypothetical protein
MVIKVEELATAEQSPLTEAAAREALEDVLRYRTQLGDLRRSPEFDRMPMGHQFVLESIEGSIDVALRIFVASHRHIGERIRKASDSLREGI